MPADRQVLQRLRSARGHLDAVLRMAEEERYCLDILHQLSALEGSLQRVRREVLEQHLRECVPAAIADGDIDDLIDELLTATFGGPVRNKGSR